MGNTRKLYISGINGIDDRKYKRNVLDDYH